MAGFWKEFFQALGRNRVAAQTRLLVPMYRVGMELPSTQDFRRFADDGYRKNTLIFSCINEIASSIAEPELRVYREDAKGKKELDSKNPLVEILSKPNRQQSQFEWLEELMIHLQVAGNVYIWKSRSRSGRVVELWNLRPDRVRIIPDAQGGIERFVYSVGEKKENYPAGDIIHLRRPDPSDDYYGLSPIAVLARYGDLDSNAADMLRSFFLSGTPTGLIKVKGQMEEDNRRRLKEKWREEYSGLHGWASVAVMDDDADYKAIGSDPKNMDLRNIFTETETRICMTFGVPPIIIGASIGLLRSTYENYESARRSFWRETLKPLYTRIGDKLTHGLVEEFAGSAKNAWIDFDLSTVEILQESLEERRKILLDAWEGGLLGRNELRELLGIGLEPLPGPDVFKIKSTEALIPAELTGQASAFMGTEFLRSRPAGFLASLSRSSERDAALLLTDGSDEAEDRERHEDPDFVDVAPRVSSWRLMHRVADDEYPRAHAAVMKVLREVRAEIKEDLLLQGVSARDVESALRAVNLTAMEDELREAFRGMNSRAISRAGDIAAVELGKAIPVSFVFDATDERVVAAAEGNAAELVTRVSAETRLAIREEIVRGLQQGVQPLDHSKRIQSVVGLTRKHAAAVNNLRLKLMEEGLSPKEIAKQIERKRLKLLRWRARNIARTETMMAAHIGQNQGWGQAMRSGVIPSTSTRKWIVTPDERAEEFCLSIPDLNSEGVGIEQPFNTPAGPVAYPPAHPQCRCSVELIIGDRVF